MEPAQLREFLNRKVEEYNTPAFVAGDPISVPHRYAKKQDREIAGFFAATFAWGNRTTIINKSRELMALMDDSPHDFIINHKEKDLQRMEGFCHRTFNVTDLLYFIAFLRKHYQYHRSLEDAFLAKDSDHRGEPMERALNQFYHNFFSLEHIPARTRKHIAAPFRNSSCKRLNMYLRWMVRNDKKGVDFGLWKRISPVHLICPLDLHVGRVARGFGLLQRPLPDWQAAVMLTSHLRELDPLDPVKYDFALFALGAMERF